jgi:hypothetical protein
MRRGEVVIHRGDEFIDDSGDYSVIRIEGKHFNDVYVSIWKPSQDEDVDDLEYYDDAIFTKSEIARLANARSVVWDDEEFSESVSRG